MRVAKIIVAVAVAVASALLAAISLAPSRDMIRDGRGNLSRHGARLQDHGADRGDQRGRLSARRWQHRNAQNRRKPWWFLSAVNDETQAMSAAGKDQSQERQMR